MDKSALKKFATNARRELLERVELQARKIGITREKIEEANVESSDALYINGKQLSDIERRQRNKLIKRIEEIGFDQVMEETAYTWFNRFIALRFMEVNNYLPTRVRVLSSESEGSTEPDMMKEALSLDLPINKEYVYELKIENKTDELFKYLIKLHCNDLNRYMPFMFESIEDYKEILFPEGLLGKDSFLQELTNTEIIPEADWENVEIIGWLYQYYISEEKDKVFADFKKNIKINKNTLPAATQLFTSNWIVRLMVENSLGKMWLDTNPDSSIREQMEYYLDEAEQEETTREILQKLRRKNLNLEEVTFLDPACGSGHILVYAFDLFYDLYLDQGYMKSEIPKLILENNIFGLDIDDRAVQLASFSVMMKAREKNRRIFNENIKLNIHAIQDTEWLTDNMIDSFAGQNEDIRQTLNRVKETFQHGKLIGSLALVEGIDTNLLKERYDTYLTESTDLFDVEEREQLLTNFPKIIDQVEILQNKYSIVCTNPPYMGRTSMNDVLKGFLDQHYKEVNADLFAAFFKRAFEFAEDDGYISLITMESWMFLSSYEEMRKKIINEKTLEQLIHMPYEGKGRTSLGINFGTAVVVIRNQYIENYANNNMYISYKDIDEDGVPITFPVINDRYKTTRLANLRKIPGQPIAYWVSENFLNIFDEPPLSELATVQEGLKTGNNEKFIRKWFEIDATTSNIFEHTPDKKWVKHTKGGAYKKWYGNNEDVLMYEDDGAELKKSKKSSLTGESNYFKEMVSWTRITSAKISFRYTREGFIPNMAGLGLYATENLNVILGYLNSKVVRHILNLLNPTINYSPGLIAKIPFIKLDEGTKAKVEKLVDDSVAITKKDWDSFEISWDFTKHPLLEFPNATIQESFNEWEQFKKNQFEQLRANEEELNQIFIEQYGVENELTSDIPDEDITIRKADVTRDMKSFISYAVGCMLGRYSLDEEGLIFAGGKFDPDKYKKFPADEDNILPILSTSSFKDDIVSRFIDFVKITYGEVTLEENLSFIADALGRKKNETARETIRRYFLNDFYKDHVQTYQKRPIYWLFTSGRQKAFNCLVYMHRYDKTTLSRIRTDYLHNVQARYDTEKEDLLAIIESADSTAKEIRDAKKELKTVEKKIEELKDYDENLHHLADQQISIDLDHGVKENYGKFKGLVAKI